MTHPRKGWSFTILLHWDFSKSWSHIQKVGVKYSKFGVNETSVVYIVMFPRFEDMLSTVSRFPLFTKGGSIHRMNIVLLYNIGQSHTCS